MRGVGAVILDYRKPDMTIRCTESLRNEGFTSIVIVDNSEDGSVSPILESLLKNLDPGGLPKDIVVLTSRSNRGFAGGMNFALKWLILNRNLDFYLLLNNDAVMTAGSLKRLITANAKNGGTCLVAPSHLGQNNPSRLWYQKIFGLVSKQKLPGAFPYLSGCCLLVPKNLARVGFFDEAFFMYGEDVLLGWKMQQAGHKFAVADISLYHLGSASAPHGRFFYEYHVVRGHFLLVTKLGCSSFEKVLMFLGRTLALGARAVMRSFRQRSSVPLQAFITVAFKEMLGMRIPYSFNKFSKT
jgi:N-acetylglucosaminyl-diphospho-decaprenol L-rhamnosyltransferase